MLPTAVMVAQGQHYRLHRYYIEEEEREREGVVQPEDSAAGRQKTGLLVSVSTNNIDWSIVRMYALFKVCVSDFF